MTAIEPEELALMLDTTWKKDAACRGIATKYFYSRDSLVKDIYCARCPVRKDCLEYALLTEQSGTWGGMSKFERDRKFSANSRKLLREDYDY